MDVEYVTDRVRYIILTAFWSYLAFVWTKHTIDAWNEGDFWAVPVTVIMALLTAWCVIYDARKIFVRPENREEDEKQS